MPEPALAAIMIHVADIDEARAWYARAFPSAVASRVPGTGFEYLVVGDVRLEFVPADEKVSSGPAGTIVYWEVPRFAPALAYLQSIGAKLYRGPLAIEDGRTMCQVRDPWGNCIGLRGPSSGEAHGVATKPAPAAPRNPSLRNATEEESMPGPARTGVLFYAKDLARVSAFYETLLGARVVHADDEHRVLQSPDVQLIIHAIPARHADGIVVAVPPVPRDEQAIKPFFTVASLAAAGAVVAQCGGLVCGPVWPGPGMQVRNVCDPEGNIVHLREFVSASAA
jgi:predicted enzyme related to lactoylglutathione lyase